MALESWTDPMPSGRNHVEVAEVEDAKSSKGDGMWRVTLKSVGGWSQIKDVIMTAGGGLDMGVKKLQALGVTKEMLPLDPWAIKGRRCYVTVGERTYTNTKGKEITGMAVLGEYEKDPDQAPMQLIEPPF